MAPKKKKKHKSPSKASTQKAAQKNALDAGANLNSKVTTGPDGQMIISTGVFATDKNIKPNKQLIPQSSALVESHRRFIENEGIDIYTYARMQGYSVFGAKLLEALGAQEAGYNSNTALDKYEGLNNFFGIDAGKKSFDSKEEGIEYLMDKDNGLLHRKYALVDSLLKTENPSLSELDKGFKGYNLDANGKYYATWLENNDVHGVTKRTVATIDDDLRAVQDKINFYEPPGPVIAAPNSPFDFFSQDNTWKENSPELKELKAKRDKLEHMKQELETGKSDGSNWYGSPIPTPQIQPPKPVPFAPGLEGAPGNSLPGNNFFYKPKKFGFNDNKDMLQNYMGIGGNQQGDGMNIASGNNSGDVSIIYSASLTSYAPEGFSGNIQSMPSNGGVGGNQIKVSYNYNFGSVANFHGTQNNVAGTGDGGFQAQFIEMLTQAVQDASVGADVH